MTPDQVTRNEFLTNLGTDYVAVSANGTPIARADTLDGAKRAVAGFDPAIPDDAFFTGADFAPPAPAAPIAQGTVNWLATAPAVPAASEPVNWMAKSA